MALATPDHSRHTSQLGFQAQYAGPDFSPVVKNRARDLLRAVGDGDMPIAHVHDLARAVIEAPAVRVARQILQDRSPQLAVRRALELASMALSS